MKPIGKGSLASTVTFLLNVAWGVVALGLVLAILLLALSPMVAAPMEVDASWLRVGTTMMTIPVAVAVDERAQHVTAPSIGVEEAALQDLRGSLRFPARKDAFFFANAVVLVFVLALALWVIGQLRAVFRTVRDGHPFVRANADRLRRIAYGVIAGELARSAIVYFENAYAMRHFTAAVLRFVARPDVNGMAIAGGLIILVVAEVFREGTRLDEEQSLTV
jgi:hypothetical protein